jgi:hypothetical protein
MFKKLPIIRKTIHQFWATNSHAKPVLKMKIIVSIIIWANHKVEKIKFNIYRVEKPEWVISKKEFKCSKTFSKWEIWAD